MFDPRICETFTAPTNIAVIKYWGKGDVKLNTPMNSSVSVTLDQADLHTITTVAASKKISRNRLWLNGTEIEINGRAQTVIRELKKLAQNRVDPTTGEVLVAKEDWSQYGILIASVNTFPTGAGLASSAAGLACLVASLAQLFCCKEEYPGQLTAIARQGSGSASRSLYGGFVRWQKGELPDGKDSIAVQIADEKHWPEMRAVVLVVSDREKDTSSTSGMETSRLTSPLLQYRAAQVVPNRLAEMEAAYLKRDFETFGILTMKDSNQFHATCLDTYPPIFYMNDISKVIIRLVHVINTHYGTIKAAYTFDAGPNAVIYCLEKDMQIVLAVMGRYFPSPAVQGPSGYCSDPNLFQRVIRDGTILPAALVAALEHTGRRPISGDVKYIFVTKPGPGPVRQGVEESLLDPVNGTAVPPSNKHKRLQIAAAANSDRSAGIVSSVLSYGGSFLVGAATTAVVGFLLLRANKF